MPADPLPTGRRGRYICPFCRREETEEPKMIEHRRLDPECSLKNDALRAGVGV